MNRTFQRLEVFGSMTAYDNIRTAAEIAAAGAPPVAAAAAPAIADGVDRRASASGRVAGRRADALPTGQARLVELGRALATEPKVVLLDEPASGLDEVETRAAGRGARPSWPTTAWPSCSSSTTSTS